MTGKDAGTNQECEKVHNDSFSGIHLKCDTQFIVNTCSTISVRMFREHLALMREPLVVTQLYSTYLAFVCLPACLPVCMHMSVTGNTLNLMKAILK